MSKNLPEVMGTLNPGVAASALSRNISTVFVSLLNANGHYIVGHGGLYLGIWCLAFRGMVSCIQVHGGLHLGTRWLAFRDMFEHTGCCPCFVLLFVLFVWLETENETAGLRFSYGSIWGRSAQVRWYLPSAVQQQWSLYSAAVPL